jgi:hypothetical protein
MILLRRGQSALQEYRIPAESLIAAAGAVTFFLLVPGAALDHHVGLRVGCYSTLFKEVQATLITLQLSQSRRTLRTVVLRPDIVKQVPK